MTLHSIAVMLLLVGVVQIVETLLLIGFWLVLRDENTQLNLRCNELQVRLAQQTAVTAGTVRSHNSHIALYHSKSLSIHEQQTRKS